MADKDFTVKIATLSEIQQMIDWAAAEGWNPGLSDAACYASADPEGFFIGYLGGEPVASISAVKYGDAFAFIGLYIVKPECRGKGYGLQIWKYAMQSLPGRNVGLDGVLARQEDYGKSGFKLAYRNIRYSYESTKSGVPDEQTSIVKLASLPDESLAAYNQPFFPVDRPAFFKAWINQPESTALGILREGKLAGLGVIRKCRSGYKIGPLHADNREFAATLFEALVSSVASPAMIYLDVPEINAEAMALVENLRMTRVFETARMYTGPEPEMPLHRVFGVTSFEIG